MGAAAVPLIITAASTAVSVAGQQQQARAQESASKFQAAVARNNAIIAERKAQDAIERGKIAEREKREETAQLIARQRAAAAASGVLVDTGSILDITSDTAGLGELDALTIRSNAAREAQAFRDQAAGFESEAQLTTATGANARTAGNIQSTGTLLEGASRVSARWRTLS